jgi:tetratricopeptide (TPR) repeat protein
VDRGRGDDRGFRRGPSGDDRRDERWSADRDDRRGGYRGRDNGRDDRGPSGFRPSSGYRRDDRDGPSGNAGRGRAGDGFRTGDDRRPRTDDRPASGDRSGRSGTGRGGYDRSPRPQRDDRGGFRRDGATTERRTYGRDEGTPGRGFRDPDRSQRAPGDRPSRGVDRDDRGAANRGGYGTYRRPDRDDRAGSGGDDRRTADRGGFRRDDRGGTDRGAYRRDDRGGADRGDRGGYRRDDRGGTDRGDRGGYRRDDSGGAGRGDRAPYRRDDRPDRELAGADTGVRDDRRPTDRPTYRVWDHERPRTDRAGRRPEDRDRRAAGRDDVLSRVPEPSLPDDVAAAELDAAVRRDLRGLQKDTADAVARHLVAAGSLVDDDPEQALAHARYARQRASRIAVVREAAGIAAYHAGEWNEALGELRAARRMGGGPGHLAVMADIERALGRPERAIELARTSEAGELDRAQRIELAIVAAGARRDLGELDAAVVGLQLPELDPARQDPWSPRLFYAYADNLLAAGRTAEAVQWFVHAADVDDEGGTDAAARLAELTGDPVPDADDVVFGEAAAPVEPTAVEDQAADAPVAPTAAEDQAGDAADVADVALDPAPAASDASDAAAVPDVPAASDVPSSLADPVSERTAGANTASDVADPDPDGEDDPGSGTLDPADGPR